AIDGDQDRARIEGVGDVEGGGDLIVLAVRVLARLDGADLDEADLGVGVEQAGGHHLAVSVDPLGRRRQRHGGADGADLAVFYHQGAVLDRPLSAHRMDRGAGDDDRFGRQRSGEGTGEGEAENADGKDFHGFTSRASRMPSSKSVSGWWVGSLRSKTRAPSM